MVRRTAARQRVGTVVAVAAAALALSACVETGSSSDAFGSVATSTTERRQDRAEDQPSTATAPSATPQAETPPVGGDPGVEGIPVQPAELTGGVDECARMAEGPWKEIPYGADPVATVRAGRTPPISTAPGGPILDEIVEFETLADYDDPSTLIDPEAVARAFADAGFQEGVAARHVDPDGAEVSVTALRFRDAAAAGRAMSAHIGDYCGRAASAAQRTQGNGMVVLRNTDSVRTFFVLGDVEVSVFVCSCYYPDAERRTLGVQWWTEQVETVLVAPGQHTDAS